MRPRYVQKILFFLLLLKGVTLSAELRLENVRLDPLPEIARFTENDQSLTGESFQRIILLFSGIDRSASEPYLKTFQTIIQDVAAEFGTRERDHRLADDLLQWLHRRYLKKYDAFETSLAALLDRGVYNCVSSSLFYQAAADELGLVTGGVRTKDHAFVTVTLDGQSFDVETTSSYGFDPGQKKEFSNEFGKTTGFVYTPPGKYSDRREIGRREMASLILNNRIAELTKTSQFDLATGPGADLFELLKNEEALKILLGIYGGASRLALDTRQFETGQALLERAVSAYREFDQFQEMRRVFVLEWTRALIEAGSFQEAQALLKREREQGKISADDYRSYTLMRYHRAAEAAARDPAGGLESALALLGEAKKELGEDESLARAERVYAHNLVLALIEKGRFEQAAPLLERFSTEKKLGDAAIRSLLLFFFQKQAETAAREHRYAEALVVLEAGLARMGKEAALLKSAGVYAYNQALKLITEQEFAAAEAFIRGAVVAEYADRKTRDELLSYLVKARADDHRKKGEAEEALTVLEQGCAELGHRPDLFKSYEVAVHNHMIVFYERQEYARAEAIILRGLRLYPASALFKNDLEKIKKLSVR